MVNFVNSIRLRVIQITGKSLFLGVSMRVFPEETNIIRIGRLSRDHPCLCRWHHPIIEGLNIQKGGERKNLLFVFGLGHSSFPAHRCWSSWFSVLQTWTGTYAIGPLILGPLDSYWITLLTFLVLQPSDSSVSQFL